jgi:hypothetical protein
MEAQGGAHLVLWVGYVGKACKTSSNVSSVAGKLSETKESIRAQDPFRESQNIQDPFRESQNIQNS